MMSSLLYRRDEKRKEEELSNNRFGKTQHHDLPIFIMYVELSSEHHNSRFDATHAEAVNCKDGILGLNQSKNRRNNGSR
jgi:hypothetical protein